MAERPTRSYSSPLREHQAQRTRESILDALTELLSERRADEIATREIAARAGVSQPTVYRHFPDREALLVGLSDRLLNTLSDDRLPADYTTIDTVADTIRSFFAASDSHVVEARAEALLNADPRRFGESTRLNSDRLREAVDAALPHLDERERVRLAGVLRCLGSAQTWLRMHEEFGVPGTESGPVVAWAVDTLIREVRAGNGP